MAGDSSLPQLRFAIGEAAQILRISRVTLYQRINAGLIQIQKDGRSAQLCDGQRVAALCELQSLKLWRWSYSSVTIYS
jgi:hypothetical protein